MRSCVTFGHFYLLIYPCVYLMISSGLVFTNSRGVMIKEHCVVFFSTGWWILTIIFTIKALINYCFAFFLLLTVNSRILLLIPPSRWMKIKSNRGERWSDYCCGQYSNDGRPMGLEPQQWLLCIYLRTVCVSKVNDKVTLLFTWLTLVSSGLSARVAPNRQPAETHWPSSHISAAPQHFLYLS